MPLRARRQSPSQHLGGASGEDESYRLARSSHILAAAVREALERNLLRKASRLPLSLSQLYLLRLMSLDGQHQVGELAGFLGVSPPAATKTIEKLVRLGLLTRAPSEGDRRATLLAVSAKGRRLVERYEELKAERIGKALAVFERRELRRLQELLDRFSLALLRADADGDRKCLRCAAYLESGCVVGQLHGGCRFEGLLPMPDAVRAVPEAHRGAVQP